MNAQLIATILLAAGCSLSAFADNRDKDKPTADRYNVTDANGVLPFGKSYYELDGRPSGANGNFYSSSNTNWSIKQWPDKNTKKHIATYLHFPKCKSGAQIELTTTGAVQLKVVVTSMETGRVIAENTVDIKKGTRQWVDILPETQFYENGWYKVDFECTKGVSYVGEFFNWKFSKVGSTEKIYTADYMSSPSVHLSGWKTTDPDAPQPAYYDWVYEEVMVPEESAVVGTYCMSLGVLHGYMGIQIDSEKDYPIIFSMWDNGSTDEDPNLPQYLRSGALDWEQGVTIARFANEGTGAQAKYRTGKNWIPGKWVKFISNARPEVINVEVDDPTTGGKKTITYTNTLCSAWFMADGLDDDWHYIATIRQSGANNYFDGWYSFLENYNWPSGQWQRKAYYRNGGLHSLSNGKWYHANKVGFGHTDGGDKYGDRRDYGQGKTEDFDDCFFMTSGGYANNPVQNQQVVPLKRNFMPVDQETLDRLTARVDAAIRKEQIVAMKENVSNACTVFPQGDFKITGFSDQTIENNVNKAESVFDGDEGTYWHSQWSGGEKAYPHYLTVEVNKPEEHSIGQISLYQKRASNYRAKQLTVYTSDDNKTWTKHETVQLEDAERPNAEFSKPIQSPYLKLQFDKGYGTNLLCINEIYFKSAPSLADLKAQAQSVIDQENQFNGYSSEALADLKAVYAEGAVDDFNALSTALNNLAANAQPLKFGRVDEMKNLSSFKAYQIHSLNKLGELVASKDGSVNTTTERINVVDPLNNWHIIHVATSDAYCIYNLGLGKFLKAESGNAFSLVDEFTPIKVTYNADSKAFRFGTSTRNWEVRDNYVAQPSYEIAAGIIAAVERAAEIATIQAKADGARALLAEAQADAALDFDKSYAGEYDLALLADVLDRKDATIDDIASACDALRASTMPATDRYYRITNAQRPTADSRDNYLQLAVSGTTHSFTAKNTTEFGASPAESGTGDAFRLFAFERAANDTTFYVRCTADERYLMTQNADQGVSAQAREYAVSYEGGRLFRLASGGKFLSVGTTNKLAEVSTKDAAGRFYFREVTELENAISVDDSGYGTTCLPAPIVLPEGVEALIAIGIHDGYLDVRPLNEFLAPEDADVVPAYVPVILRTTDRKALAPTTCSIYLKSLTPTASAKTANDVIRAINKANILAGTTCRTTITKNDYVFGTPAIGLEKATTTTLLANKAYIPAATLPYEQNGAILPVGLEGLEGIELVISDPAAPASTVVYDLQGRACPEQQSKGAANAQHGVFIVSGKKVVR